MLPVRALASSETASLLADVDGRATTKAAAPSDDAPSSPPAEGDEPTPEEVAPQRVSKRVGAVRKTKPTRRLQPGDLVCGQCGEGNAPTRKFCSRCGDPLDSAETVRAPWYRKLAVWRRKPKTMEAGARPGQEGVKRDPRTKAMGTYRKLKAGFGALLLLSGMLYLFVPPLRGALNRTLSEPTSIVTETVRGWWSSLTDPFVTVPVESVEASLQRAGHPGDDAFDGNTNSFWSARWAQEARPRVRVIFEEARDLDFVVVTNGAAGEEPDAFLQARRLRIRYGNGITETVDLEFDREPQSIALERGSTIKRLTVTVQQVHAREGVRDVAIREIEFKTRE